MENFTTPPLNNGQSDNPFHFEGFIYTDNSEIMDYNFTEITDYNYTIPIEDFTTTTPAAPAQMAKHIFAWAFKVVYVIGIAGNIGAIMILWLGGRRFRNRKHLLLLTALAANDLVALVGMLSALMVSRSYPWVAGTQGYCAARVVLRVFGIGSVCIAVTMAMERYLALTRPFLYHKRVTYFVIRTTLLVSWCSAALLTCAPIVGLGIYWDGSSRRCLRYKNVVANDWLNFGYAVFYVGFGAFLCLILVYCNIAVIIALSAISPRAAPVTRSVSRKSRPKAVVFSSCNAATAEEVQFSWLMAALSLLFMVCWMPQMITSVLFLAKGPPAWQALENPARYADLMMLLNYVLNPLLYVLMRRRSSLKKVWRAVASCCKHQRHKTSTGSTKTSGCLHDTLLTSESSAGSELRPLRTRILVTPAPSPLLP